MNTLQAYILAGGHSSRMGQDKGLLLLNNKPLIQFVLDAVQPLTDTITIITNNKQYSTFGYTTIPDDISNIGPAGGIATALRHASAQRILVLSCDTPCLTTPALEFIVSQSLQTDITIPQYNKRLHPLCGVYNTSCRNQWQQYITNGVYKVQDILNNFSCLVVTTDSHPHFTNNTFRNINTPQQLQELQQEFS